MSDGMEQNEHNDTETLKLSKSQINMPRMCEDRPEPEARKAQELTEMSESRPRGWLARLMDKVIGRE